MKIIVLLAFLILPLLLLCIFSTQIDYGADDIYEVWKLTVCNTDDTPLSFGTHSPYAWEFRVNSSHIPALTGSLEIHEQIYTDPLLDFRKEKPPRFI
jgi:hypothetical protein